MTGDNKKAPPPPEYHSNVYPIVTLCLMCKKCLRLNLATMCCKSQLLVTTLSVLAKRFVVFGQVVSVLAFFSDDLSTSPAKAHNFYVKLLLNRKIINKKKPVRSWQRSQNNITRSILPPCSIHEISDSGTQKDILRWPSQQKEAGVGLLKERLVELD